MQIIITGVAGFIGFHVAQARLKQGDVVVGIDNINEYYDPSLKKARLKSLQAYPNFIFYKEDLINNEAIAAIFKKHRPSRVIHLAAQAGVRYSLSHPQAYIQSNVLGFTNLIEACRQQEVEHLVYASTSSVYGANGMVPNKESDPVNHPLTIYAASKKANELTAHAYSSLYQLPSSGLRFFTVYGPWGRPDMAFFSFTKHILEGKPIQVYNHGNMQRDFTYIDDIVDGISRVLEQVAAPNPNWQAEHPEAHTSQVPYCIYNIGSGQSVNLLDYIGAIEKALGKKAIKEFLPLQAGDVLSTRADISLLHEKTGYTPKIHFEEGIHRFVAWYRDYFVCSQRAVSVGA